MNTVAVIQARTNSSRLPGKVLLPINGVPLIVCAAKRAENMGLDVIVVTSTEKSDDYLCRVLESYNIKYFRGSLDNTLHRFVLALRGYDDKTIVVRLTGDNLVPDGKFISEVVEEFVLIGHKYLTTTDESSGLPYGLSAEVMYLDSLREAEMNTNDKHDCEHVTPFIKRRHGIQIYNKLSHLKLNDLRCTIDTLDDYLYMADILQNVDNVIDEPFLNILNVMSKR